MDNDLIVKNFHRINENFMEAAAANHDINRILKKHTKKIRGLRVAVFGASLFCGFLFSRLAERKRSENYLQEQIDGLKERLERTEKEVVNLGHELYDHEACDHEACDGGVHDA